MEKNDFTNDTGTLFGINYQVLREGGDKYHPDYDSLIENSKSLEEAEEWKRLKDQRETFAWNMIYSTKMACGHAEVFQSPVNQYYPLSQTLCRAKAYAEDNECTHCILSKAGDL